MTRRAIEGPGVDSLPNESIANLLAELAIANRTYRAATAVAWSWRKRRDALLIAVEEATV
jgi:hypothetical protein